MVEKIIDSTYFKANIRSSPNFGDNVILVARQGTRLEVIDNTSWQNWVKGTLIDETGLERTVFVGRSVLRDPVSEVREDLMSECIDQFYRFKEGDGKENIHPFVQYIAEFWRQLGEFWDGSDQDVFWSAAFISYVIRKSGGFTGFKYSMRHSDYIHQSIQRKLSGDEGPFWGFRLNERKPQLGDIVCKSRTDGSINYDHAIQNDNFPSHTDIIVRIEDGKVQTIGGNVSNSVNRSVFWRDDNGFIKPDDGVFAIMGNMR